MADIRTQQDLYNLFKNEVQGRAPKLTDFEVGSNLDALGGGFSVGGQEIITFIISEFAKTFFNTANGSDVTGNTDDLQNLARDHFGESFARPGEAFALVTATFSRENTDAGNVVIPKGTIVKTDKDANGNELRFETILEVTMTGLFVNASVIALAGGSDSNVETGTIINVESSLTDSSVVVTNDLPASGGDSKLDDPNYREFIRRKVDAIRGATGAAIEAAALNVPGVVTASIIESIIKAIEYDTITGEPLVGAEVFDVPRGILYVADANGTATEALIDQVHEAIEEVRACGVVKLVYGATALIVDWTASYTLNPAGPNFAELNSDPSRVTEEMEQYIRELPIGQGFNRALANNHILNLFGPTGTDDLTDFVTSQPTGNIAAQEIEKLIPGSVEIV